MTFKYYQPSGDNPWIRQGNAPTEPVITPQPTLVPRPKTFDINVTSGTRPAPYYQEPYKWKPIQGVFPETNQQLPVLPAGTPRVTPKKAIGASPDGSGTYLIPKSINPEQAVKLGTVAATSLGELALIGKVKKAQQQRNMLMLNPVQTSVRPVTDLPSEILNQRKNDIDKIRSTYAGSDAAMQLIGQNQAAAIRDAATDRFSGERAQHLITEQNRVDQQNRENQQRQAEMQNINTERRQTLGDYKLESNVNALDQKKKLLSEVGKTVMDVADTSGAYKTNKFFAEREGQAAAIDTDYRRKEAKLAALISKGDPNHPDIDRLRREMKGIAGKYSSNLTQPLPGYWTHYKNGGKLIPRI